MFCSKCGNELDEGARFCGRCGAPVEEAPASSPAQPVVSAEASPQKSKRKTSTALLAVLIVALLVGVACAGYFVYTTVSSPSPQGQQVDEDAQGQQADEDAQEQQSGPSMYALYKDKCDEIIAQYGESGVGTANSGQLRCLVGLAYAELVDFDGDGAEELFVVYFDSTAVEKQGDPQGYFVEVWRYDAESGDISLAFKHTPEWSNGGLAFISLATAGDATYVETMEYGDSADAYTKSPYVYSRLAADGAFAIVADASMSYDSSSGYVRYTAFNADGQTYTDFTLRQIALSEFTSSTSVNNGSNVEKLTVDESLAQTRATLTQLGA